MFIYVITSNIYAYESSWIVDDDNEALYSSLVISQVLVGKKNRKFGGRA